MYMKQKKIHEQHKAMQMITYDTSRGKSKKKPKKSERSEDERSGFLFEEEKNVTKYCNTEDIDYFEDKFTSFADEVKVVTQEKIIKRIDNAEKDNKEVVTMKAKKESMEKENKMIDVLDLLISIKISRLESDDIVEDEAELWEK